MSSQARLIACHASELSELRAERAFSRARARLDRTELGLSMSRASVRQTLNAVAPGAALSPGGGPLPTTASALSQAALAASAP